MRRKNKAIPADQAEREAAAVVAIVCKLEDVPEEDVRRRFSKGEAAHARKICYWIMTYVLGMTGKQIGKHFDKNELSVQPPRAVLEMEMSSDDHLREWVIAVAAIVRRDVLEEDVDVPCHVNLPPTMPTLSCINPI